MARSDAGAVPLVIETVPAVELVRQSVRSAARRHGLAEPPIEIVASVGEPFISVDRRRFERVMANLIDNAHYYAGGASAVRIDVEGHLRDQCRRRRIAACPWRRREAVFERFFRGRAAARPWYRPRHWTRPGARARPRARHSAARFGSSRAPKVAHAFRSCCPYATR